MLDETRNAVLEWEGKLKGTERYPKDRYIWEIDYTLVSLDKKAGFDFSACDVTIQYKDIPENPEWQLEKLGIAQYSDDQTTITIFYTDIVICTTKTSDAKYIYTNYDPCYSDRPIPSDKLGTTVRHEFGHALGLGHYASDDEETNQKWSRGQSLTPSIMVKFSFQNEKFQQIRPIDVEKVLSVYGEKGFLSDVNEPELKTELESNSPMVETKITTFEKYTNEEFGFSINYLDTWFVDDSYFEPDTGGEMFDMIHYPVDFFDTEDGWVSRFQVKYIENDKLAGEIQGSNYLEAIVDILKEDCILNSFDNVGFTCSNHTIIDSKIIQIDGRQAYQAVESFTETYPDQSYYETTRILIDIPIGNNVWTLDTTTDSSEYPKFANTIQEMVNSFHIIQTAENVSSSSEKVVLPDWIRNNAKWWAQGAIGDNDFVSGIQYLIKEGIIQIPETVSSVDGGSQEIPSWIKNNADWWVQGLISDDDFVKGIQYLVEQGPTWKYSKIIYLYIN